MTEAQSTVDMITAALEGLCACNCGVKLDPDGASMWYATPECQWRFQQQHAHRPGDVYNRPDAVDVWVGADARRVPIAEPARRGGGFRDALVAPGERIPYQFLSGDEREALHAWVELHDVDHSRVPVEGPIEFDAEANEWLITVHAQRDGRSYLDENGVVAREVLRRPNRADLPWPRRTAGPAAPRLQMGEGTRVWMNGEEITHHISSVTVERQVGERTRIGLNGGEPVVRDNVRVEVEQGGARYVIDEQRVQDDEPLPRLSAGPLRHPLSDVHWRDYWPHERVIPEGRATGGIISNPGFYQVGESGCVGNILGVPVASSPLVPPVQIMLVDRDAMRESLRVFGEELSERFREAGRGIRTLLERLAEAVKPVLVLADQLTEHRRNTVYRRSVRPGYCPSSSSPRRRVSNKAYRRRVLSRRRRR